MSQLEQSKMIKIEGVVYCLEHGCVHEDTLDPYGEGVNSCFENMWGTRTKAMIHRTVYYRGRKGDWEDA